MATSAITGTLPLGSAQYHQQLADAISMDANNVGIIFSKLLELGASAHNCFDNFTSTVDPKTQIAGGVRSIFAKRRDLAAGGGSKVHFNVLGPPGGPGAKGAQSLVDRVSRFQLSTYYATVAYHRDAIGFSEDDYEFLSAGRALESTAISLLSEKMGTMKQNHMMMRLIKSAVAANTYRPNNRTSRATLTAADTMGLDVALSARARLSVLGGKPLMQKVGPNGSPVKGYLIFGTDMAFLPLRNDTAFMNIQGNGKAADAVTTGELFDWQGMPWYEFPSVDQKWDDYLGSPLLPKAKLALAVANATPQLVLKGSTTNTQSEYFQFFPNSKFAFDGPYVDGADGDNTDAEENYAWIINPDGSVGFVAYLGTGVADNNNTITVNRILSTNTTGANDQAVGNLIARTSATTGGNGTYTPTVGETNLPTGWTYTDQFAVGAIVIPANANGVPIGYGFVFGSMAACFADGRIAREMIKQDDDFGFVQKRGFKSIFGTCVTKDPYGVPAGYLLVEHAVEHEGYPVPQKV